MSNGRYLKVSKAAVEVFDVFSLLSNSAELQGYKSFFH